MKIKNSSEETIVEITDKGKTLRLKYELDHMTIDLQNPWDRKWRIVIFDIPERYRELRDRVRYVLKKAGFVIILKTKSFGGVLNDCRRNR